MCHPTLPVNNYVIFTKYEVVSNHMLIFSIQTAHSPIHNICQDEDLLATVGQFNISETFHSNNSIEVIHDD